MDNGASSYRRFRDSGDDSGLEELIRDYKDGLIFYIASIVGNINTAEELAEDVFVMLGTKKPRDKGTGSFKTWLYTIGRNVAIDRMRQNARRRETAVDDADELTDDEQELEEAYIREERRIAIHRAMRGLSPDHRQILWLVYFEGITLREAAAVMKRSVHSAETLVYRARKALKEQLEAEGFDHEKL